MLSDNNKIMTVNILMKSTHGEILIFLNRNHCKFPSDNVTAFTYIAIMLEKTLASL